MAAPRYAKRKDENQNRLVSILERMGCEVIDMSAFGDSFPDLLVVCRRELLLVEVKNPESRYGKKGLNDNQKDFAAKLQGASIYVVSTDDDCIEFVQGDRESLRYDPPTTRSVSLQGRRR